MISIRPPLPTWVLMLPCIAMACNSLDSGDTSDDSGLPEMPEGTYTHKMMKKTGENQFAALAYECAECTFEQHLVIKPPVGWTKGPTQVAAFTSGELRSMPSFDGVPAAMDFVPEVPGEEYELIAKNLEGTLIEAGSTGIVAETRVMRDTLLRFAEGRRVHELTDPDGRVFVLFAYEIDPADPVIPDFDDVSALGDFSGPDGWEYSTRVLDEDLLLDTPDIATVLAIRTETTSTWELR